MLELYFLDAEPGDPHTEFSMLSNGEDSTTWSSGSLRDLNPTSDLSGLKVCHFCWLPTFERTCVFRATTRTKHQEDLGRANQGGEYESRRQVLFLLPSSLSLLFRFILLTFIRRDVLPDVLMVQSAHKFPDVADSNVR